MLTANSIICEATNLLHMTIWLHQPSSCTTLTLCPNTIGTSE